MVTTADPKVAFKDADVAVLVGAMPRKQGMERKDLLKANAKIFKEQGEAMNAVAKKTIKVLVVGNPANTNAFITSYYAKDIPKENFTALTRLDHNRAQGQLALRLNVNVGRVKNVVIWGNHSSTQYPDVSLGYVADYPAPGQKTPIADAIKDTAYLQSEFIKVVQQRGAAVIAARKLSSALSAAKAICDHLHDWIIGTREVRAHAAECPRRPVRLTARSRRACSASVATGRVRVHGGAVGRLVRHPGRCDLLLPGHLQGRRRARCTDAAMVDGAHSPGQRSFCPCCRRSAAGRTASTRLSRTCRSPSSARRC